MHFAPHAVSDELAYHRKTIFARFIFDFGTDIADAAAFMSGADRAAECIFCSTQQLVGALIDDSHGNCRGVVANPSILNDPDVELHDIAILNAPLTANPMDHFVVQGDTNVPGENAMPQAITKKGAFYAGIVHEICGCLIHFLRRDSGTNEVAYAVQYVAGCAAGLPHLFDFPGVLDWNHFAVLSSISLEMSANTA